MSKISRGPWVRSPNGTRVDAGEPRSADINGGWSIAETFGPQARENARAIEALPDLLSAAIRVRDNAFGPTRAAALADLYIAISKAEGKP